MTVNKPRTIDNLGIETSNRYARDQAALDTKLLEEARFVSTKTEVSVIKPYISTEFEGYTDSELTLWASFSPPPEALIRASALFSYQLIPSLGGYEKQEEDSDKLEALEDTLNKGFKEGGQGKQEEEKKRKTLVKLLKVIGELDRTLTLINARRNQYQRG
jgi:hypothetical protein